jgi:predicted AlkP superfamily phosphohydrolase/phosphomutase
VVVIGLDGIDPGISEAMMASGELPALARLREGGGYARIATTLPAQTPVAWSTFAVGVNPGAHGIFDFLRRDPSTYLPEIGLYRHEERGRLLPPRAVNLRGGVPVWERLSRAGIPSTVLRHPCTYPPAPFKGRLLAGIGVPDLRGGFGTSTFFSAEGEGRAGEGERFFHLDPDPGGRAALSLPGPLQPNGEELVRTLDLEIDRLAEAVRIACPDGGFTAEMGVGAWTGWMRVNFRQGRLQRVWGLVRFHLASLEPLRLFASPVHFDPEVPLFPISHPWDYASELARVLGPYATLGLAEEHNGLTNGRLDEGAFLAQCLDVMEERRAMMHHELSRHREGLFYCLFGTPDRIQHMFWRFHEAEHPANRGEAPSPEMARVIPEYYRRCDDVVGEALEYASEDALFIVLSDHGFCSFQREVHLNTWLHAQGYLTLREGMEPGDEAGDLLRAVDWGRTRAYALGMAGIFLNLRGREGEGIVDPGAAPGLREEIARQLRGLTDPGRGRAAVRDAWSREAVYRGPYLEDAPDVLVGYAPGYRMASGAAMGGIGGEVFSDNLRPWSGDHVVDPATVPGVCFMSTPFRASNPGLADLAPTILDAMGVPGDEALEGRTLL